MQDCPYCPLCKKNNTREKYIVNGFQFNICDDCSFVFQLPKNNNQVLEDYYNEETLKKNKLNLFTLEERTKQISNYSETGPYLDIGFGASDIIGHLKNKKNYEVWGIETSKTACEIAKKKGLQNIIYGDLFCIELPKQYFEVISLFHVLEHVSDPIKFLEKIKTLLKKNGVLIIETPNFNSMQRKIFQENWHYIIPNHHLNYFSFASFKRLSTILKFQILEKKKFYIFGVGKKYTMKWFLKKVLVLMGFYEVIRIVIKFYRMRIQ